MQTPHHLADALNALHRHVGVVIPVYFPEDEAGSPARSLLRDTVAGYVGQLGDPGRLCLAVDGAAHGGSTARELAAELGVTTAVGQENGGKLQALRQGMARLLQDDGLRYLAAVDMDGDHFPNELVNLVRAAAYARGSAAMEEVLVIGRRTSRHRPMGLARGELEELADRMLLDALAYDAAVRGCPLRLELVTAIDEFPDFHSGYKLFSRHTAEAVFLSEPDLCGATPDAYFRHGCEAVMCVEALQAGAHLVSVNRSTFNEQPVTTFGRLDRVQLVADKMIWPCLRLGVPERFVDQWLRNHLPRLLLATLTPQGKEELLEIRRRVLTGIGGRADEPVCWGPLFI